MTGFILIMRLSTVMLGCVEFTVPGYLRLILIMEMFAFLIVYIYGAVRCGRTAEYRCCVLRPGCKEYSIESRSQSRPDLQFII